MSGPLTMQARSLLPIPIALLAEVLTAAEIRAQQWRGIADGEEPSSLVSELHESSPDEATFMARSQEAAIQKVFDWLNDVRAHERSRNPKLDARYIAAARTAYESEGELEIDDEPIVSQGEDPGAYVNAWVWVSDEDLK